MVFLCVTVNLLTFLLLQSRISGLGFWRSANPSLWLTGVLVLGALVYAFNYSDAAQSTQALMLLAGASLGVGARVWSVWRQRSSYGGSMGRLIVATLIVLLLAASLWPPEWSPTFALRGYARWTGPWNNPNIFGLLIGVGVALAFGSGISVLGSGDSKCKTWKYVCAFLSFFAAILMGRGLLHSYSRGAWLSTFCGTAYLFWNLRRGNAHLTPSVSHRPPSGEGESLSCASCVSWFNKNWLSLSAILLSVVVLSFWHFRQTEWYPARRAFSVTNTVDSTWRNRVAAWECALQITAENPCFGSGWNQPGRLYKRYYSLPEAPESAVIELNDYLLLGATLGIPALICFGMYVWLALTQTPNLKWGARPPRAQFSAPSRKTSDAQESSDDSRHSNKPEAGREARPATPVAGVLPAPDETISEFPTQNRELETAQIDWLQTTCRTGAIVLLIGFWFDGGLFRLPTAATFWILLELGRRDLTMGSTSADYSLCV